MINELQEHYEEFKKNFDILPTNNKANRQKKIEYLEEEDNINNEHIKLILNEIKLRLSAFHGLTTDPNIEKIKDKISACNITNEWNKYNTSYEKMHLDFYLYQLNKYTEEDLNTVNECIKKIISSFNKVGITLTKEDFDFNNYVRDYMELIINNASEDKMKNKFEEIYWKFPEIIKTIETNFKSIYLKKEKLIDKYYMVRNEEFHKKYDEENLYNTRIKLNKQLRMLKRRDGYLIFNNFINKTYFINTFANTNIDKLKNTYFAEKSYNYDNLIKLSYTIYEYYLITKYNFILNNMKERLEKKDEFKSSKSNAIKQINQFESQLSKLNKQNNSKWPFKKKNDEKWLFKYNEVLKNLITAYDNFDNERFNDLIFSRLSQDSTVLEVFKFISSNYLYFVEENKKNDDSKSISEITKEFNELKEDINNKQYSILNNIALLDRKQMKQIIIDKFKLEDINLTIESLEDANIEKTINDINDLINYEDICKSEIDIDDIELYLEYNAMLSKN